MNARTIFGIDPGNNGGIVQLTKWDLSHEWRLEHVFRLSRGEDAIVEFLKTLSYGFHDVRVYLEQVHGWGEGRSFNFGKYYGFVRGVCKSVFDVDSLVDVTPQRWMKEMGVPPQKGQKAAHRQAIRALAGSLQDEVTATNWNAAAILIALYGLRQETGRGLRG